MSRLAIPEKRIWELDLLKGIAFIFMVFDHVQFDLSCFWNVDTTVLGVFKEGVGNVAAFLFMFLCGVSVTLGRHNIKHGLICFGLGMALTLGTWAAELVVHEKLLICFGIMHFLGIAMICGHFAKKLNIPLLAILALVTLGAGIYFKILTVNLPFLFPFGLTTDSFYSSDYFPLFPNLAYVFFGIIAGKLLYKNKKSLIKYRPQKSILCWLGRNTLVLYFVHQPVVVALLFGIMFLIGK